MNMPTVALPRPPKVAAVDRFKLAYPEDPYASYGQYGHEKRDDGSGVGSALAIGGLGALGAGALHGGLMASRGQFARGYQANLGNAIRESANKARKSVGFEQVPLPPHGIVGGVQDLAHNVNESVKNIHEAVAPAMAIGGTAAAGGATVQRVHNKLMNMNNTGGDIYKRFIGAPIENAVGSAGERLKEWVSRPAAAKQTDGEMGKVPEKIKAAPQNRQTKPSATRYRAYVPGQGYATPSAPSGTPVQNAINAARSGGSKSPGILQSMANRLRGTIKKSSLDAFLLQPQR